ncbi:MAG TPA: hypothetical protein VFH16_06685 [Rubrobacter sp.]|nr:hypothetical protein [Rubrobacter sp.]
MYDTLCIPGKAPLAAERKILASEVWQFLMVVLGFFVVAMCWIFVVYLPGRTLERGENRDSDRGDGKAASPAGPGSSGEPLNPGS